MARCEIKRVVPLPPPPAEVVLTLNEQEGVFLRHLLGNLSLASLNSVADNALPAARAHLRNQTKLRNSIWGALASKDVGA